MNLSRLLPLLGALVFSGCASMPERFEAAPPQVHEFAGTPEQVAGAAKQAFKRLDFRLTRSGPGRIEAVGGIHSSETLGDSRQTVARVDIHQGATGNAEMEMWVTEDVVGRSLGGTQRNPKREHSLYSLYFAMVEQVLHEQSKEGRPDKN